jgi:cytochrome P450
MEAPVQTSPSTLTRTLWGPPRPGPTGLPSLHQVRRWRRDPLGFFAALAREHGDLVWLRLARLWLVSDPALVEQILVQQRDEFVKDRVTASLSSLLGNGLLTAEGETWRRDRKLCAPSFQPRHLAVYGDTMVDAAMQHLPAPGERDVTEDMAALALDVVLRTLFGTDAADQERAGRVGQVLGELMAVFVREQRTLWRFAPAWVPGAHRKLARTHTAELHALVLQLVEERRRRPPGDDLLSRLLEARDEDGAGMDDAQIRDQAVTLFLAGHETTALALSYALYLLARHPDAQDAVRDEVSALGRLPGAADLAALPWTAAVVQETLRLYPPAWAFGREPVRDVTLGGQRIAAGEHVIAMPWILHRDPRWWHLPERFRPERWRPGADGAPPEVAGLPRFAYAPFGGGPRVCIGNHFATMEAILALAALVRHRRFRPVPGFAPDLVPAVTLRARSGVLVRVEAL